MSTALDTTSCAQALELWRGSDSELIADWSATICVRLYICWGTFPVPWPRRHASWHPNAHPCKKAHDALKEAGYSPNVVKSYGFSFLPDFTQGRREAKRLTGASYVPVLVLDDGQVVADSENIVAWARDHPVAGADR